MSSSGQWVTSVLTPDELDSSDVRWAVETASALLARGDRDQAVRWLHHAVQTANGEGRRERADALDRAAQELARGSSVEVDTPAAGPEPSIQATTRSPGASKQNLARTAPYKVALDDITRLGIPDPDLLRACEPTEGEPVETRPGGLTPPEKLPAATAAMTAFKEPEGGAAAEKKPVASRPLPPVSEDPFEATVVNAGMRPRREKTLVMPALPDGVQLGLAPGAPPSAAQPSAPVASPPPADPQAPPPPPVGEPAGSTAASPNLERQSDPPPTAEPSLTEPHLVQRPISVPRVLDPAAVPASDPSISVTPVATDANVSEHDRLTPVGPGKSSDQPPTLESPNLPLEPMRAVRVAILKGSGKELSVRLLGEGEKPDENEQEALLLALR